MASDQLEPLVQEPSSCEEAEVAFRSESETTEFTVHSDIREAPRQLNTFSRRALFGVAGTFMLFIGAGAALAACGRFTELNASVETTATALSLRGMSPSALYSQVPVYIPCAGEYGKTVGDVVCCGQDGTIALGHNDRICPQQFPCCHGFVQNDKWGSCTHEHVCEMDAKERSKGKDSDEKKAKKEAAEKKVKEKKADEVEKRAEDKAKEREKEAKTKAAKEKEAKEKAENTKDAKAEKAAKEKSEEKDAKEKSKEKDAKEKSKEKVAKEKSEEKAAKEKSKENAAKKKAAEERSQEAAEAKKNKEAKDDDSGSAVPWWLWLLLLLLLLLLILLIVLCCCTGGKKERTYLDWRELLLDKAGHHLDLPFQGGSDEFDLPEEWDKELRIIKDAMTGWPCVLVVQVTTNLEEANKLAMVKCKGETVPLKDLLEKRAKHVKAELVKIGINRDQVAIGSPQFKDASGGSRLHVFSRKLTVGEMRSSLASGHGQCLDCVFKPGTAEMEGLDRWNDEFKSIAEAMENWGTMKLDINMTSKEPASYGSSDLSTILSNRAERCKRLLGKYMKDAGNVSVGSPTYNDPSGRDNVRFVAKP